ncbi:hypothetical protein LEP1GSC074_1721 [Leptospira noguchii str. Hook]|nr:hypothetical protein LEP1GSC074_1721 [Leptospira noguchii str. Hook]
MDRHDIEFFIRQDFLHQTQVGFQKQFRIDSYRKSFRSKINLCRKKAKGC